MRTLEGYTVRRGHIEGSDAMRHKYEGYFLQTVHGQRVAFVCAEPRYSFLQLYEDSMSFRQVPAYLTALQRLITIVRNRQSETWTAEGLRGIV